MLNFFRRFFLKKKKLTRQQAIDRFFSRIDTDSLYQPFYISVKAMLIELFEDYGDVFIATSGYRNYSEQLELYDQGRIVKGNIVTNARPGESFHNFGLAIDVARDLSKNKGLQPGWKKKYYKNLGMLCKKYDLIWGGDFKSLANDYGHIQYKLSNGLQLRDLAKVAGFGGKDIEHVWKLVDKYADK